MYVMLIVEIDRGRSSIRAHKLMVKWLWMRFGSMADHPIWSVPLLLTDKAEEEQDGRRERKEVKRMMESWRRGNRKNKYIYCMHLIHWCNNDDDDDTQQHCYSAL